VKQNATLDSSFWVNVHRAGLSEHLLCRYRLWYAPAVGSELDEKFPSGREFWRLVRAGGLTEVSPDTEHVKEFGPGERSAINVVLDRPDWLLLLDYRRPFEEAVRLGLRVLCSPVLVTVLFLEEELSAAEALTALARLAALQTVSPHLLAAALAQLGKSLPTR
jgi:hypothetical protein